MKINLLKHLKMTRLTSISKFIKTTKGRGLRLFWTKTGKAKKNRKEMKQKEMIRITLPN